jgi:hypothetical protein
MGRVLRFTRPHNAPTAQARYPRLSEVSAHIAHIADEAFGSATSLEEGAKLYGELEQRLAPEDRELLAKLYDATVAHEEKFEHAAYLVGLMAGSGQLPDRVAFLDQRMAPDGAPHDNNREFARDTRRA